MPSHHSLADGAILLTAADDRVGRMEINRPSRRNALNDAMWRAIPEGLDWLVQRENVRIVIISGGGGRDFSAGADIGEFETLRKNAGTARVYERANAQAFAAIRRCPAPVIASIRGICFGGGFGLAAAADLRIADETARFAIPAARLGLAYPVDAVQDLVRALGDQTARRALYSASELSAAEALACGCLVAVHAPDQLDDAVSALAGRIASAAPLSVRASKSAIAAALSGDSADWARAAADADATFDSRDYAEGRLAFSEKRKPRFSGK